MALVVALVVAVAAVAGVVLVYRERDRVAPKGTTAVSHTNSAPATNPPALLDQDGRLFFMLAQQGLQTSGARETTINEAHQVCDRLRGGESQQQIVQDIVVGSPGMSEQTAAAFADIAISVYCPQG